MLERISNDSYKIWDTVEHKYVGESYTKKEVETKLKHL